MPRTKKPKVPAYAKEALALAQKYDPDQLLLMNGQHFDVASPVQGWRIALSRPDANFYIHLYRMVPQVLALRNAGNKINKLSQFNAQCMTIGVAAKDSDKSNANTRFVQQHLSFLAPWIETFWLELQFYRAVLELANQTNTEVHPLIQDARRAWGVALLSEISFNPGNNSRVKSETSIREQKRQLTSRQHQPQEIEERTLMVELAWLLLGKQPYEDSLPNYARKIAGRQRKRMKQAMTLYRQSLTDLAAYVGRDGDISAAREVDGEVMIVVKNGALQPVKLIFSDSYIEKR